MSASYLSNVCNAKMGDSTNAKVTKYGWRVHRLGTVDFHQPRHSLVEDIEVQWENIVEKQLKEGIEFFTPEQLGRQENMLFRERGNFG